MILNHADVGPAGNIHLTGSFAGTVDFGASDAAMKPEDMAKVPGGVQLFPMTAGSIVLAERQQKFFVTIEDNKQLAEDWCFSADALDDLKRLRRGEKPGTNSKTQFLDPSMFFTACQAQFRLSTNGGPIDSLYHSDNLNIFRDEFSQFWLRNGLNYIWQFVDLKGNAYLAEGGCEKIYYNSSSRGP